MPPVRCHRIASIAPLLLAGACSAMAPGVGDPPLPFTARGQEPGWLLEINTDRIHLLADYGAFEAEFPAATPEADGDDLVYRTEGPAGALQIRIREAVCADVATGMPHPYRVEYVLDGEGHDGCGGNPSDLLTGAEWTVDRIGGEPVAGERRPTLRFGEDGDLAGHAHCNHYTAGYGVGGEGISIDRPTRTLVGCRNEAAMEQENRFFDLLGEVRRFGMDGRDRLILHAGPEPETRISAVR